MTNNVYQPEELFAAIDTAAVSADLKSTLKALVPTLEPLLPHLSNRNQLLTAHYFNFLLREVTAVTVETYWWELHMALIKQVARDQEAGQPLLTVMMQLEPQLQEHFGPRGAVTLQKINSKTVRGICRLSETLVDPQDMFVAPNAHSLAQAYFVPHAWVRAVYAGRTPVGFIMLADNDQTQEYFLWRYMVAAPFQGHGYGRAAINLLVAYVRTRPGAKELLVSCVPHPQGPYDFYVKCGFVDTGKIIEAEIVLKMVL